MPKPFHIRTVILTGIFSEQEDDAFHEAIGNNVVIGTPSIVYAFYENSIYRNSYFRGSINLLAQCPFPKANEATPMHVFNWMFFTRYIPHELLVNHDFKIMYGYNLPTTKPLFIRCATGDKRLAGDCYTFDDKLQKECALASYADIARIHRNDLLVVSLPKNLQQEQRFVVYKNDVLTGSEYVDSNGKIPSVYACLPQADLDIAKELYDKTMLRYIPGLQKQPFTLDIAYVDGVPKILEINSFWSAGLYGSDIGKVISILNEDEYFM